MMLDMSEMADRLRVARVHAGYAKTKDAAEALGIAPSTYAAHENGQNKFKEPAAKAYGKKFGVRAAWLLLGEEPMLSGEPINGAEQARSQSYAPTPNASFPPRYVRFPDAGIPLMGQTSGGANGRFVMNGQASQTVFCPPDLEGVEGAYAVRVHGYSMEPKFEAGDTVWLNPHAPVRRGDYVVVQVQDRDDGEELSSYIKQFVSRGSGRLRLKQFNPEEGETEEIEFPDDLVFSVHKIVFHALA
jgi:phage repressor protein C with HTH and peptisase S24 domain